MARYASREPVGHTCPLIDEVKELIYEMHNIEMETPLYKRCIEAMESLEKIRTMNGKLRDWGDEEAKRVDELEKALDEMESDKDREISALQGEIDSLNYEIKELTKYRM